MTGFIHSIETMGLVDGPGIRCVVFMQGCLLRCKYCHNPDTWRLSQHDGGAEAKTSEVALKEAAWGGGCEKGTTEFTPQALVERLLRYKDYFGDDGGVTFSGGEPLLQPEFLEEALRLCKENGIHTCIDTGGVADFAKTGTMPDVYDRILDFTDLVLFDIKHVEPDGYKDLTGKDIKISEDFLDACIRKKKDLWLSHVLVPQFTDNDEFVNKLLKYILKIPNVKNIRILPYHVLGAHKYKELGINEPLSGVPPMDKDKAKEYEEYLKQQYYKEKKDAD